MDLATLGGLVLAAAAIAVAEFLEGGSVHELVSVSALVLIVGGTLGATVVSYALSDLLAMPRAVLSAFRSRREDTAALIGQLLAVAEKARREGLLSLQDGVEGVSHPMLRRGLMLVADGVDPAEVESELSIQSQILEESNLRSASVLETAGGYAPTIGIIGTVIGLVRVLGNMEDQSRLAGQIAVAFLATLYGIATANLIWLPLAAKLKLNAQAAAHVDAMILEALSAIQGGIMPRRLQDKLSVYLPPGASGRAEAAAGGDRA